MLKKDVRSSKNIGKYALKKNYCTLQFVSHMFYNIHLYFNKITKLRTAEIFNLILKIYQSEKFIKTLFQKYAIERNYTIYDIFSR